MGGGRLYGRALVKLWGANKEIIVFAVVEVQLLILEPNVSDV